jgi:hypothetical protein
MLTSNTPVTPTNIKVNITAYDLFIILFFVAAFGLVFFSSYFIDAAKVVGQELEDSRKVSKSMADLSIEIEKLNLNTDILNSQFLRNVTSMPTYPLDGSSISNFGKPNPFTGSFKTVVGTSTDNVVGGIRYTSQTNASTSAITTTPVTTTNTRR